MAKDPYSYGHQATAVASMTTATAMATPTLYGLYRYLQRLSEEKFRGTPRCAAPPWPLRIAVDLLMKSRYIFILYVIFET